MTLEVAARPVLSGWVAQARGRINRRRHRDALMAPGLVELATTRLRVRA
jgi:hypothetical protein